MIMKIIEGIIIIRLSELLNFYFDPEDFVLSEKALFLLLASCSIYIYYLDFDLIRAFDDLIARLWLFDFQAIYYLVDYYSGYYSGAEYQTCVVGSTEYIFYPSVIYLNEPLSSLISEEAFIPQEASIQAFLPRFAPRPLLVSRALNPQSSSFQSMSSCCNFHHRGTTNSSFFSPGSYSSRVSYSSISRLQSNPFHRRRYSSGSDMRISSNIAVKSKEMTSLQYLRLFDRYMDI